MSEKVLTHRHWRVLGQLRAHQRTGRCFWWSPKTCADLAALGWAEQYTPPSVAERPRMKARPYRITPAGRAALEMKRLEEFAAHADAVFADRGSLIICSGRTLRPPLLSALLSYVEELEADKRRLSEALIAARGPLHYAYQNVSSVTADRVKNEILPAIDAALSKEP